MTTTFCTFNKSIIKHFYFSITMFFSSNLNPYSFRRKIYFSNKKISIIIDIHFDFTAISQLRNIQISIKSHNKIKKLL
ncbi:MAG: hypothetical protein D3904_03145 [Candidatus Electrothrix sp. EH2]|nr:hypothetical protein [Candidatus Electrothrix sp. EH2]